MAPNIRSSQLETRTARAKLQPRRKPYSVRAAPGIRLGYRRNIEGPGTWSVICADGDGGSWMQKLGLADDKENADGKLVMDYWKAIEAAKQLARASDGPADGNRPITVKAAVEEYLHHLESRGQPGAQVRIIIKRLPPALAAHPVSMLSERQMIAFRDGLLATGIKSSTCTRYMATFAAAMNRAAKLDKRIRNSPWKLEALPSDTEDRNVILSDNQVRAVIAAGYDQDPAFGLLAEVLGQTGARISQALRLTVDDVLPGNRLNMPVSRKGKGAKAVQRRPLPINAGLAGRLRRASAGRKPSAPLLLDGDGKAWARGCQERPFKAIVKAVGLDPAVVTVYALRHTSITRQLLQNVPVRVVAASHDTSVRMIEKTYSKYITDVADDLTRKTLLDHAAAPRAANDNAPLELSTVI